MAARHSRNLTHKRWRSEGRWIQLDDETLAVAPAVSDCRVDGTVANAVQSLPPLQREVVILIEYEGLTLEETAHAVATEIGTVKARLHRARHNLRRIAGATKERTMTDDELRSMLGTWKAPPAPETLRARVFHR